MGHVESLGGGQLYPQPPRQPRQPFDHLLPPTPQQLSTPGGVPESTPWAYMSRLGFPEAFLPDLTSSVWVRAPLAAAQHVGAARLTFVGPFDGDSIVAEVTNEVRADCLAALDAPFAEADIRPSFVVTQPGSLEIFLGLGFIKSVIGFLSDYDHIRANTLKMVNDAAKALKWFFRGMLRLVTVVKTQLHLPRTTPPPILGT
jgi:hypothetical protein